MSEELKVVKYEEIGTLKEAITLMLDGETVYAKDGSGSLRFTGGGFTNCDGIHVDLNYMSMHHHFYRKVVTTVSRMRLAKDAYDNAIVHSAELSFCQELGDFTRTSHSEYAKEWDESFIELLRVTLDAYDSEVSK